MLNTKPTATTAPGAPLDVRSCGLLSEWATNDIGYGSWARGIDGGPSGWPYLPEPAVPGREER